MVSALLAESAEDSLLSRGAGGGIAASPLTRVEMANAVLLGNSAIREGGGLFVDSHAHVAADNLTLVGNDAAASGGGMQALHAMLQLSGVVNVSNNTAAFGQGGGIALEHGLVCNSPYVTARA